MTTLTTLLVVMAVTALVIGLGMAAMAIGVIGTGRCLRGSCGGSGACTCKRIATSRTAPQESDR